MAPVVLIGDDLPELRPRVSGTKWRFYGVSERVLVIWHGGDENPTL